MIVLTRLNGQSFVVNAEKIRLVESTPDTVVCCDSGEPVIAAPLTLGSGGIRSGALEQSNVDLSEEFINMIVASTGFTAASRVITTSDQLITELLNSSR